MEGAASSITVFVNGQRHKIANPDPNETLQEFLSRIGLTGTKLSCGQGACGACTVNLAKSVNGKVVECALNACIRPLVLCDGCAITTTEGLGTAAKPHPVQERIACMNGSQCGFCTPGQVMAMYSLLRENASPTPLEVESCLTGNLCRCTGYRAINAAFHTFAGREAETNVPGYPKEFAPYDRETCDPVFPKQLVDYKLRPLYVQSPDGLVRWHRVLSLDQWAAVVHAAAPEKPRVVVGNTSVGILDKAGQCTHVDLTAVPELQGVRSSESGVTVGGAESLSSLIAALQAGSVGQQSVAAYLSKIASRGVRNVGGWAGNLAMGRVPGFPSDGAVALAACGATVEVAVAERGVSRRALSVADFLADRKLDSSAYVLTSLTVPSLTNKHFHSFKQANNKANAHSIVSGAFCTGLTATGELEDPTIVYGCIGERAVVAHDAMAFLKGKSVSEATLQGLLDVLRRITVEPERLWVTSLRPEGKDEFKRQLLEVMAFKWFCSLAPSVAPGLQSMVQRCGFLEAKDAVFSEPQTLSSTAQLGLPEGHPGSTYVGPRMEAYEQACGQTKYSGDMPMGPLGSYGYFVTAQEVGVLEAVDASAALEMEGVLSFVDHTSVMGMNSSSFVPGEERLFLPPGEPVQYAGMIVGLVVATSQTQAKAAAARVSVSVAPPQQPPIFTIEDAVSKKSFLYGPDMPGKAITVGDPDTAFNDPANVITEGDFTIGGQNHFYMEKQTVTATPEDMGRVLLYGGTQGPDATKTRVMMALGCSSKDIVIKNRPMGGSFGGKFTKQLPAFCAAAVACKALGRPVRVAMDIHTDMGCCGNTRHIVKCHYRVASTKEGKLVAFDNTLYVDAGFANDYTDYIVDEMMKRQDLAYDISHYRVHITICKTNNASATPVRAPGLAQAGAISETIVEAVARHLKVPQERVQELSLKPSERALDATLQEIPDWNMPQLWEKAKEKFDFEAREKAHCEFNAANRFKKRAAALMPLKYAVGYILMAGAQVTVNVNSVDGTVAIQTGCCDSGQGCLTKVISTCASELRIPVSKVSAFYPDTSVLPNLTTDGGSAGSEVLCEATKMACAKLKAILEPVREELLSEKKAAGQEAVATWEEVVARAQGPMPTDTRTLLSATAQHKVAKWNDLKPSKDHPPAGLPFWNLDPLPTDTWAYYVTGAACSDVEVDVTTGEYTVLRSDVLMDAGHSLNPLIDLGQAEGGFAYGLGMYLKEETLVDPADGKNKSQGGWNYWPLNNKDAPRVFNVELLPGNPSSRTAYGSKGVGEPPLLLAYSAVSALKKAILASRLERGLSEEFVLNSPATVDRVQQCMGLQPSELSLDIGTAGKA